MSRTEAQKKAAHKWRAEKMHRVALDYTLSDYARVKQAADAAGLPVGTFCRGAIEKAINAEPVQADMIPEPVREPFFDAP